MDANGRSKATQKSSFVLLKTALGVGGAVGDRRLAFNPCERVRPPRHRARRREQMTRAMFEQVLAHMPTDQDRAIALAGAYAGLRWSELTALRRRDWNPLRKTVTVSRGIVRVKGGFTEGANKTHTVRELPVPDRLAEALNRQVEGRGSDDLIFSSRYGNPLSHSNYRTRTWVPAVEAAGCPQFTFHDTRHSYASWLIEGGASLKQVMDLMGHSQMSTTGIYIHSTEERQAEAVLRVFG
jgi:integrase